MKVVLAFLFFLGTLFVVWVLPAGSQELPPLSGKVKVGVSAISQDGSAASTMESYNISKGLTLSNLFLIGRLGPNNTVFIDVGNVTRHQRNARLEFMGSRVFNLKLDHTRMRHLQSGAANPEFTRERTGLSGSITPRKWLKLYGGISSQEKQGDRVALLSEGTDFPGTRYDYSMKARSIGSQLRRNGRSVDLNYEWRQFESDRSPLLNRDGRRLRVSVHVPVTGKLRFSGFYLGDKSILNETDDVLCVKSYSGILTLLPAKGFNFSGYVSHKNAENDFTDTESHALKAGSKATIEIHPSFTAEFGYEYTRREDEFQGPRESENTGFVSSIVSHRDFALPLDLAPTSARLAPGFSESEARSREVSGNAFLFSLRARPSDKARLTFRYRTRASDRNNYTDLTGPFDTDNFLARLESWPSAYARFSVAFEDKDRSNDELMTSGQSKGITGFADLTYPGTRYRASLRLDGSVFNSEFKEQGSSFATDNILLSARLRWTLFRNLTVETGITHIEIKKDLNIRKDVAVASVEYEFITGYAIELRYDLFSYDDLMSYRNNFAANVFTLNFSKKFGSGDSTE